MKEKIIQKATDMFLTLGFKSVTMDDIAAEMAISKKTIYAHFKNKTTLVRECTCAVFHNITSGIDEIRAHKQNPITELYEIRKYVMERIERDETAPQYQLQKYYPEISNSLKESHFEKIMACISENLRSGMALGIYRSNLDVDLIARLYYLGVNGIKDQGLFPLTKFPLKLTHDQYLEYHLRGIVTPKGFQTLKKFINEQQPND